MAASPTHVFAMLAKFNQPTIAMSVTLFVVMATPSATTAIKLKDNQAAPSRCEVANQRVATNTGHSFAFVANGNVVCPGIDGQTLDANAKTATKHVGPPAPKQGDPCSEVFQSPLVWESAGPGLGHFLYMAHPGEDQLNPKRIHDYTLAAEAYASTHSGTMDFTRTGIYEPSANPSPSTSTDPSSSLVCNLKSDWVPACPQSSFAKWQVDVGCARWTGLTITAQDSPSPDWRPYVAQEVAQLSGHACTIHSPQPDRGLVNSPTCYWVDDLGIPGEVSKELILPGPPNASKGGRQIYYVYLISIKLLPLHWDFDDPAGNDTVQPLPECGQHAFLTAHSYVHHSDGRHPGQPDPDRYHVTVKETYDISVTQYWVESLNGSPLAHSPVPVDPGVPSPTIAPHEAAKQFIGQVIPIGVNR